MRKIAWFLTIVILSAFMQPCLAYANEKNPVIFKTDFEDCRKNYFPGMEIVYKLRANVEKVDSEHEKSIKLSSNNLIYWTEEAWNSDTYHFSFDFYDTVKGNFNYLRTISDRTKSIYEAGNLTETFVADPNGKLGYFPNQRGWASSENSISYDANKWYHIDMWFDFDKSAMYYYIDGERIGSEGMSNIKNIEGLMFLIQGTAYLDNIIAQKVTNPSEIENAPEEITYITENNLIDAKVTSDVLGNSFFDDEVPTLTFTMKNTSEEKAVWNSDLKVIDENNQTVWQGEYKDVSLEAGESFSKVIVPDVKKFGIYKIKMVLNNGTRTIERNSEFSLIKSTPKDIKNTKLGICTHIAQNKATVDSVNHFVDKAGFGFTRDECYWSEYETAPGIYEMPKRIDEYINKLSNNGIGLFQLLAYGSMLYLNNGDWYPTVEWQLDAYENYCYNIALAQKGRVKYYEAWNEWDQTVHTPEQYAESLKRAYKGVKRANPDAVVVGMCPAGTQPDWIEKVLIALDGTKAFDAISVHPYCFPGSPEKSLAYNVGQVNSLMERYGYGDVEVWGTEFGFPVTPTRNTEREQAVYGVLYYCVNDADKLMDKIFFYDLQNDGWSKNDDEHNFGMIRCWTENGDNVPYAAKPVYLATAQYNAMVGDGEFQSRVNTGNDNISMYNYKQSSGEDVLITTTKNADTQQLSLDLGVEYVTVYDMYGNEQIVYGNDGKYSFAIGNTISYIKGNFKYITPCKSIVSLENDEISCVQDSYDEFAVYYSGEGELSAVGTQNVKVSECTKFVNGKAFIKYETGSKPIDNEIVKIKITNDNKIIYSGSLPIKYVNSASIEDISVKPYTLNDITHWLATVTIKNNRADKEISGNIKINSPTQLKEKISDVKVEPLQTKKTNTYYIHFPDGIHSMSVLDATFEINTGEKLSIHQNLELDTAPKTANPPVIDGDLSEWDFNGGMYVDDINTFTGSAYGGLGDLSGKAKVMWDDEYMYFAAQITDDVFSQDAYDAWNIWAYDSIQLGIASSKNVRVPTELGIALTNEGSVVYGYSFERTDKIPGVIDNVEVEVKRSGLVTSYEMRIPWREFIPDEVKLKSGTGVYFSMLFNDNDNDSRGRGFMEYGSGIATEKTAAKFLKTLLY